ncbi:hypothetical protein B0H17DRAFT_1133122 [Mycena rosella]|uniref:Uncharacterized protein n=1 Tax=Mycena rosella TaxID=1033263 RepID=A0AAD7DIG4_MYCRO|nr:hypothetical protein B0H17DRAFT_1133122 [Mycena rosella]
MLAGPNCISASPQAFTARPFDDTRARTAAPAPLTHSKTGTHPRHALISHPNDEDEQERNAVFPPPLPGTSRGQSSTSTHRASSTRPRPSSRLRPRFAPLSCTPPPPPHPRRRRQDEHAQPHPRPSPYGHQISSSASSAPRPCVPDGACAKTDTLSAVETSGTSTRRHPRAGDTNGGEQHAHVLVRIPPLNNTRSPSALVGHGSIKLLSTLVGGGTGWSNPHPGRRRTAETNAALPTALMLVRIHAPPSPPSSRGDGRAGLRSRTRSPPPPPRYRIAANEPTSTSTRVLVPSFPALEKETLQSALAGVHRRGAATPPSASASSSAPPPLTSRQDERGPPRPRPSKTSSAPRLRPGLPKFQTPPVGAHGSSNALLLGRPPPTSRQAERARPRPPLLPVTQTSSSGGIRDWTLRKRGASAWRDREEPWKDGSLRDPISSAQTDEAIRVDESGEEGARWSVRGRAMVGAGARTLSHHHQVQAAGTQEVRTNHNEPGRRDAAELGDAGEAERNINEPGNGKRADDAGDRHRRGRRLDMRGAGGDKRLEMLDAQFSELFDSGNPSILRAPQNEFLQCSASNVPILVDNSDSIGASPIKIDLRLQKEVVNYEWPRLELNELLLLNALISGYYRV